MHPVKYGLPSPHHTRQRGLKLGYFCENKQAVKWKHGTPENSFFRWESIYKTH